MNNELATQETRALSTNVRETGANISASDILVPKLLVNQPTSDFGEEIKQGEILRSTDQVSFGKEVNIIPLSTFKTWAVFDCSGSKPKFKRTEPFTHLNANEPWDFMENGVQMRRDQTLNFYCLIPEDIEREVAAFASDDPDPDDALLPVVVSFSRTSYRTGRELITHFAKVDKFRQRRPDTPYYTNVFKLGTELQTGDQGKWYTWTLAKVDKVNPEHRAACQEWTNIVSNQNIQVHEEEVTVQERPVGDAVDLDGVEF